MYLNYIESRTFGFGKSTIFSTYLTYPENISGFTVTDSQGFSPYSVVLIIIKIRK